MSDSTALLASRIAAAVPRLLAVQVEPAEEETADQVEDAVERLADALLDWHDELADGRSHRRLPSHRTAVDLDRATHASRSLAAAVRSGRVPGSSVAGQTAAGQLREVAALVDEVCTCVPDEALRDTGRQVHEALLALATALHDEAGVLQEEAGRLAGLRRAPATDDTGSGPTAVDHLLGRVVRAEHRLQRVAATTLRS